jgi:uncharacterized protein
MRTIWSNGALWLPLSVALGVQLFKFIWEGLRRRDFDLSVLARAGGMPSSHSAMTSSLATVLGYEQGLDSPLFAIATVLAIIVMYDARGVRQESGKHASLLNQIMRELFQGRPIGEQHLKELLGHTGMEVTVGAVVGIIYTLIALQFSSWLPA